MNNKTFHNLRRELGKTQKQLSQLLGTSLRAVQSFEQGWRKVPTHVERQFLFLLAMKRNGHKKNVCWKIRNCPPAQRRSCPAWEFNCGHLCWFINGTICQGTIRNWKEKIRACQRCPVFAATMGPFGLKPINGSRTRSADERCPEA